jgi:aminoglycoside phosphotransferase (APT) family kinase protein
VPARVVHGDFHGDNVLVGGTSLGLIDLEDCAMGDPASDVAQYLVELERRSRTSAVAQAGRRAFSQAYLDAAGERIGARLPAHIAAHRFLAAYQCLRRPLDPAPEEDAEALLEACEDALCGGPV